MERSQILAYLKCNIGHTRRRQGALGHNGNKRMKLGIKFADPVEQLLHQRRTINASFTQSDSQISHRFECESRSLHSSLLMLSVRGLSPASHNQPRSPELSPQLL